MSKAEILQQLETLTPSDLDDVLQRVTILRFKHDQEDKLTPNERAILDERIAQYKKNPDDVFDLDEVVDDLLKNKK